MTNSSVLSRVYWLTCVVLLALAPALSATTIVMPADDQLVEKAPLIVEGTVLSVTPVDVEGHIWTDAVVRVTRAIKGRAGETITVREPGGAIDERITMIFGAPEFAAGERVLLFLTDGKEGRFRTVDLFVGKFTEEQMLDGRRLWVRNDEVERVTLLDAKLEPIRSGNVQRDGERFERFVAARAAGLPAPVNYGIENPVLKRDFAPRDGGRKAIANFTLISEPTLYRWFAFDNGGSARWYSYGTQPGYSGGGVNEVGAALAAWNGYSAAKIRYSYAGTTGTAAGLERANGVNEILFNDPLGEISGTWTPRTGGVVGTGGFNGVTNGGTWNAPFTADANHTQRAYAAWNIVEGNLTIQDGVSPSNGISSDRLAEIISHEFGHTLGFGHSAESSALMYATVSGGGPGLRPDDQVAARWLYPNGTVAPPPVTTAPAAPSNLTATVSGTQADLRWSDNASNESGHSIYVAAGSGSFTKVADLGAGVTAATLTGFAPGTYRIYVVAFNGAGNSSASNTVTVTIGASVTAAFSVSAMSGYAGQTTFAFTDQSTGNITSRVWQFGDGTTSTAANPSKVYPVAGAYTITLTVTGDGGSSSASRTITVAAPLAPLAAGFDFTPANPAAGQNVAFTDRSTGGVTAWHWTFGDGTSSSEQNPVRRFASPGSYTVTLTVFRNAESASASKTVNVASSVPVLPAVSAAFDVSPSSPSVGQAVAFADRSTGSPSSWSWNFGDGTTSAAQNPSHAFAAPGSYNVTLTVSNGSSSAATSRTVTVSAGAGAFRSLVSATAQTNGLGGSVWRTELNLFNAGNESASVDLIFVPGAGGGMQRRSIHLAPRQSASYANALLDIFGLPSGAGAVAIEATSAASAPSIKVSSRTYTSGGSGTYGQSVPDVQADDLDGTLYLTGLISNAAFRTNIGLVNRSSSPVSAVLTLYGASGWTVGVANVTLPASSFQQSALAGLFPPAASQPYDALSMRVTASAPGALSAYASVVDNATQDPVFVQARRAPQTSSLTVPVVGRAPGANGTYWRSDVVLFNPASMTMALQLRYGSSSRSVSIGGSETLVVADVAGWFGQSSGSGALEIASSWSTAPVVASRTYTTAAGGGTYGQSIEPLRASGRDVYVTGLRSDASYRSNAGFVNTGNEPIDVSVTLYSAPGAVVGTARVPLAPRAQTQSSLAALFPGVDIASHGTLTLHAHADSGSLFAYGSVVDNASGDPVFYAGR